MKKGFFENAALMALVGPFRDKTQLTPLQPRFRGQCRALRSSFFSFSLAIFVFLFSLLLSLLSTFLLVCVLPQTSYSSLAFPKCHSASSISGQKRQNDHCDVTSVDSVGNLCCFSGNESKDASLTRRPRLNSARDARYITAQAGLSRKRHRELTSALG